MTLRIYETILSLTILTHLTTAQTSDKTKDAQKWRFKDYIAKYDPKNVWEKLQRQQKLREANLTSEQYTDAMLSGIDNTDELLNLKIQNGDAKIPVDQDGRRWIPPRGLHVYYKDLFALRPRLFELMRQAIYQTRNKMTIMQKLRTKYRKSPLYKMGFLTSKTDNAFKTFSKYSYRAYKGCSMARVHALGRVFLFDILNIEERILNLWFNIDLLVDLIHENDLNCRKVLSETDRDVLNKWKFVE